MKNILNIFLVHVLICHFYGCKSEKSKSENVDSSKKQSLILDQEPPGLIAKPFAPGLVTTDGWEFGGAFSSDMQEFYFLRESDDTKKQEFIVYKNNADGWKEHIISSRKGQPFISPNGKVMHLGKRYKERSDSGWSEIKKLNAPFDTLSIMRLTASSKGTYYFDEFNEDLSGKISYSRLINGKYEIPKLLPDNINSENNFHPFIAPDESYLLFDSKRNDGYGNSDIYISYRQNDGSWGNPINLGPEINTEAWEASASITPDGKYLFFNRNMGSDNYENVDIFWVSVDVIKNLK